MNYLSGQRFGYNMPSKLARNLPTPEGREAELTLVFVISSVKW